MGVAPYSQKGLAFHSTRRAEHDGRCEFRRKSGDSVVLMSFNLRAMDQPDEGHNGWGARRRAVVRVLQKYAPDVIATQEGFEQQLRDITSALPHYQSVGKSRMHPDEQEHCDVLVDTGIFDIISEDTFWLSETPSVPKSKSWDSHLPRIATIAKLRHRFLDVQFAVISTHFDHGGSVARSKAAEVVIERLQHRDDAGLLAGDFNLGKNSSVWNNFKAAGFVDALTTVKCSELRPSSFHGFSAGPFASPASGLLAQVGLVSSSGHIDWVLSRPSVQVHFEALQAAMVPLTWVQDHEVLYPTDHFPVVVEFAVTSHRAVGDCTQTFRAERWQAWKAEAPRWRPASAEKWPHDEDGAQAVKGGGDRGGDFFVGRALHDGDWVPGKVSSVDRACYIPFDGKELRYLDYEVLLLPPNSYRWQSDGAGSFSAGAVPVGTSLYVARATHDGGLVPGRLQPEHGCCYICAWGKEHKHKDYEVLVCDYHHHLAAS